MDINLLILGLVAGFTIFFGLPVALLPNVSEKLRVFLNAMAVGILVFLMVEIMEKVLEQTEAITVGALMDGQYGDLFIPILYISGFAIGLMLLGIFEQFFIGPGKVEYSTLQKNRASYLALMIALGIGFHNFSEGLAIGQEYVAGALNLALLLAIGFGLHNATEGFGIAAPLGGQRPRVPFLLLLGLIAGGPTLLGTLLGSIWYNNLLEMFFLSLAGGAILYVIGELWHIGKKLGDYEMTLMTGLLSGFILAFGTDIFIKVSGG